MPVQTDLLVLLEDQPGIVARVGRILGRAGINIEGLCGIARGGQGILHILLADDEAQGARDALEADGIQVAEERDVWVLDCPDRPGELGRIMHQLAVAEINADLAYLTTGGRLVIGSPEFERVVATLG